MDSQRDQYLLGPVPFVILININDLPNSMHDNIEIVLYADDIGVIISSLNPIKFKHCGNTVSQDIST
jgi:hypothetical protein